MFLKSLQLSGFKSFVDKTKISLEPGITAIVGPNGCGKSNICDSLRWVFGEQSAKLLRGGKMEELIFNGSDVKKAVGMAEVSVTLAGLEGAIKRPELSSYEEITVTRRLFRSGESAYLINKTNCRLKDIVEIFLDTGISTRSFSIMEQAQVNRLIVSKPLERRYIIEEAAGVIKYKHRRNEAMNKLESSRQNLVRIQDITKELATQMNSLKRQAAKARRFSAYRDEMHEHGVALLSSEYDRLKTLFGEMDKECVELEKDVTQNEVSVSEKQRGVEGFQNQISNSEKLLAEKRQLEYEARTRIEQAHESVSLMEGQQKTIEEEKTRKKRETGTLEDDLLSLSRKFENCGSETVEITEKLRERDKEYEEEK
ncbi:MAG: AAA family ATPase, partial [Nitrospinota bacterium]